MNLRSVKRIAPLYKALSAARRILLGGYMRWAHALCGTDRNKVVFSSFKGAAFSDSPAAIAQALHAMRPGTDIVFQLKRGADAPEWVRRAAPGSLGWLREMSTARVMVDNFNRPFYQKKFSDQKYVQTWHGDRGFKRVMYDMDANGGYPDYKYMDLAVAGSDFCEKMYRTAFRYEGEVLKTGLPRNDCLMDPLPIGEAREKCGLEKDVRVLLYAPTFRDSAKGGEFKPDIDLSAAVAELERITGDSWQCVTRAHDQNTGVSGSVRDMTDFPDMALLMQASDLLITDYSSCAGDFPLLGRPVILFHGESRIERGLYFDPEKSPFMIAHDDGELRGLFARLDRAGENARQVLDYFGTNETGHSARDVAEKIIEWLEETA
jgi:CDP-glycerol glycerophosphotransferase